MDVVAVSDVGVKTKGRPCFGLNNNSVSMFGIGEDLCLGNFNDEVNVPALVVAYIHHRHAALDNLFDSVSIGDPLIG
jgi:hypothetical protein